MHLIGLGLRATSRLEKVVARRNFESELFRPSLDRLRVARRTRSVLVQQLN